MANKQALRELQKRLADRMQAAREQASGMSWLAVECGEIGFLFPLHEAGEIFPMTAIAAVAHAQPWFLGVANLRGSLQAVVDLAAFLDLSMKNSSREKAQLVALNPALETNCALLVDRLAGLRGPEQLVATTAIAQAIPAFAGTLFRDENGRAWQELRLAALARDESFLKIVV